MIYDKQYETMPRSDMEQLQIERLQTTLNRVYRNVSFYHQAFDREKVNIEKLKTVADMRYLPFTSKEDLRESYPYNMFAVPLRDIVRIHATSGTTGKPIVTGYTRNDITHWSALVARQLVSLGITEHDVVQIAYNYGLFTGGLGFHYGAERIGASVIPASAATHAREQISIMKDYKATALLTMPSYALTMANNLEKAGVHPEQLALKIGIFGAEPWSEAIRAMLQTKLNIKAYDSFGIAEIMGPGISGECPHRTGLHINEDHFIPEIIDPQTAQPVPHGETGELVLTTVTKEGFPLIRYRTGDLTSLQDAPCACGRTLVRMSRVSGRTDDMLFVNGIKVFPSQVEAVLLGIPGIEPGYRIVLERESDADLMRVQIAPSADTGLFDEIRRLEHLKNELSATLSAELKVPAKVAFVEVLSLKSQTGKKRYEVVDNRGIR